jgi:hypothetical protein
MKRGRFSDEQIIGVLKEAEAGAKVSELCRRYWIFMKPILTRAAALLGIFEARTP